VDPLGSFFKTKEVTLECFDAADNANNFFFTFVIYCVMSERPLCSIENTDLHMEQNIFFTSSVYLKKGNSNFTYGMKTYRLFGVLKRNYYCTDNFK